MKSTKNLKHILLQDDFVLTRNDISSRILVDINFSSTRRQFVAIQPFPKTTVLAPEKIYPTVLPGILEYNVDNVSFGTGNVKLRSSKVKPVQQVHHPRISLVLGETIKNMCLQPAMSLPHFSSAFLLLTSSINTTTNQVQQNYGIKI